MKPLSPIRESRIRRIAAGLTLRQIASDDGVTIGSVRQSVDLAVLWICKTAHLGPPLELPRGWDWDERTDGTPYAWPRGGMRERDLPAEMRWVLAIYDGRDEACPHCGRRIP